MLGKVLEKLATADKCTIVVQKQLDGKIRRLFIATSHA
jgi:hypothetical protein